MFVCNASHRYLASLPVCRRSSWHRKVVAYRYGNGIGRAGSINAHHQGAEFTILSLHALRRGSRHIVQSRMAVMHVQSPDLNAATRARIMLSR